MQNCKLQLQIANSEIGEREHCRKSGQSPPREAKSCSREARSTSRAAKSDSFNFFQRKPFPEWPKRGPRAAKSPPRAAKSGAREAQSGPREARPAQERPRAVHRGCFGLLSGFAWSWSGRPRTGVTPPGWVWHRFWSGGDIGGGP